MKIYNVGSVNVDHVYQVPHFVRAGETLASASLQQFPGGKGLNQSVALGKAGADVRHCALLNAADTWLIDVLREAKVDVSRIHRVSEPTGHAIIQVDETGQNCILLYPGANHCFTSSHFAQALADAKEEREMRRIATVKLMIFFIFIASRKYILVLKLCFMPK